jgi:hypothetical protein
MTGAEARRASSRGVSTVLLASALLVTLLVGSRAITHEAAFFMKGDAPRYLMNGVFLYDLLASGTPWRLEDLRSYGERYYARYPALSLGHHMPLLPVALVPFYAIFGVSIFSARLLVLACFVISVLLLYRIVSRLYDPGVAGWACLLFASSPVIGTFGQRVLAEMPANALVLATLDAIGRFRASGRLRDYLLVVAAALASLLCRPTAAYMFPAYGVFLLMNGGSRHFRGRGVALVTALGLAGTLVAIGTMITLSPFNTGFVSHVLSQGLTAVSIRAVLATTTWEVPLFLAGAAGFIVAIVNRDRRVIVPALWIASVLLCAIAFTGAIEPGRYSILAVPAYCIVAASLSTGLRERYRAASATVLVAAAAWQVYNGSRSPAFETPGYEAAAAYVASQDPAHTILYSASVDTGYFVFFVRKHDPSRRFVVLRSDKLLTTSLMGRLSVEDRITAPSDIYPLLHRFGTKLIVIEDRPSGGAVLDWLRDELRTARFAEKRRFPIGQGSRELNGVSIVVYEYRDAVHPAPDAELDLRLPLVGRRITVPLADLMVPDAAK